jgi:glycine oxidase
MRVIIVGGGVVGLSIGWRCAQAGADVTVFDPAPASKASNVAAGLLPPAGDMLIGHPEFARFVQYSRGLYPGFAAELQTASGVSIGMQQNGILDVAYDAHAVANLDRLRVMGDYFGVCREMLSPRACARLEPGLAPGVYAGMLSPDDGSVDPRRLAQGLIAALPNAGGRIIRQQVESVDVEGSQPAVRLDNGLVLAADKLVLAAGTWTHTLGGLPKGFVPEIRPYKGEVVRLTGPRVVLHTVRAGFDGRTVYLAPRDTGEIAVGATSIDAGYDEVALAGGVGELLDRVRRVIPASSRLAFAEVSAGLRPGSPDGQPVLGPASRPDVLLATGHYRVGIQLTPATAEVMTTAILTGELPEIAQAFSPHRFNNLSAA